MSKPDDTLKELAAIAEIYFRYGQREKAALIFNLIEKIKSRSNRKKRSESNNPSDAG